MLRCIIVDDEPLALDLLEDNIRNVPFLELVARCRNAMEAVAVLQEQPVDLVFSDIQMPGLNGLQLIQSLTQSPMFILITAYEQFAIESYDLNVIDYLLKPVAFERFVKACNRALQLHALRGQSASAGTSAGGKEYIFVNLDYSLVKIPLEEVVLFESLKDYVKIHFKTDKKTMLVRMSMKKLEELLPAGRFIRIHKSYIVHTNEITSIRKNSLFLGKQELPIGEQYKDQIMRWVQE